MQKSGLSKEDIRRDADAVIEQAIRSAMESANEAPEVSRLKKKLANTQQLLKMARRELARLSEVNDQIAKDLLKARRDKAVAKVMMPRRLHREIVFHLHPDRWEGDEAKLRAERCLTEFNGLQTWLYESDRWRA
jgi:hypothetical protein